MNREKVFFEVVSICHKKIHTTSSYWQKIIKTKHPAIKGKEGEVKITLKHPDQVRVSKIDQNIFLYYKKFERKYLCVVTRHQNNRGFIVTAYYTEKIKEGELIWQK